MTRRDGALHTLISLDDFMSLAGIDDRDERICRFCFVTSTEVERIVSAIDLWNRPVDESPLLAQQNILTYDFFS
ncbi:MAG: hypothetical protein FWB78_12945 [Treponema sp.]|nr:hypothetical protein [Treponema sp.]